MDLRSNQVKGATKISPRQLIQSTIRSLRQTPKQRVLEVGNDSAIGHHGLAVATPKPPGALVSSQLFIFALDFSSVCTTILSLKRMNLATKRARFHSFSNSLTHSNSIGEIVRRRTKIKRKQQRGGKIERSLL